MALEAPDTIEGVLEGGIQYHYDVGSDVLYLRLVNTVGREAYSEDTEEGLTLVRDWQTDELVGLTVVSFWKTLGEGDLRQATLGAVESAIEAVAERVLKVPV